MTEKESLSPIVDRISKHFGIGHRDVESIIAGAPRRYKSYYIPKRAGGVRLISQPAREVKALQHWFMSRCQGALKVHRAAAAYVKKKGIRQNAERHQENEFLLKMDFADFSHPSAPQICVATWLRKRHGSLTNRTWSGSSDYCSFARARAWSLGCQSGRPHRLGCPMC